MAYRTSFKEYLPWVAGCVGLVVLFPLVKSISGLARSAGGLVNDTINPSSVANLAHKYGQTTSHTDYLSKAADTIYHSFHDGTFEDEDRAISYVNLCTTAKDVQLLSHIYQDRYGKSLAGDFDEYVTYMDTFVHPINSVVTQNWF